MTSAGGGSEISSSTSSRHRSHSTYGRPNVTENAVYAGVGQEDLARRSSRYPDRAARSATGLSHWAAWESPNRTIRFAEVVAPKVQSDGISTARTVTRQ